jgi:hypothetical protein
MSPSAPLRLLIVHFPDGWRILADEARWGRFEYRVDAEEAALRLARKARIEGRDVSIWVQDMSGRLEGLTAA